MSAAAPPRCTCGFPDQVAHGDPNRCPGCGHSTSCPAPCRPAAHLQIKIDNRTTYPLEIEGLVDTASGHFRIVVRSLSN